ncbi:MAG: MarR family transcriptional regulator [Pseudomonadota bacterium]
MNEPVSRLTDEQQVYLRFFTEVGIINQLSSTRAERHLPHGLTLSQYSVLNHFVRGLPPKSPLELANAFQVTKGAMTNTIKQLEKKQFINVRPHESDGRSKIVSISQAGVQAHHDAILGLQHGLADFLSAFSPDEISRLLPLLEKIRVWLDNNRQG